MRRLVVPALLLLMVPLLVAAPVSAGTDVCAAPAAASNAVITGLLTLSGSRIWKQPTSNCGADLLVGGGFNTAGCAPATGQRCLGYHAAGALIRCAWGTLPSTTVVGFAIGTDADGDGNIWDSVDPWMRYDMPLVRPTPLTPHSFSFTTSAAGNVYVYPVSLVSGGAASDVTSYRCI